MDNIKVEQKTSEWSRSRRRKKVWQRVLAGMMSVVVFTTTYAMILPAITEEQEVFCGHEEHRHDETCFERVLICGHPAEEEGAVVLLGGGHAAQALEGEDASPVSSDATQAEPVAEEEEEGGSGDEAFVNGEANDGSGAERASSDDVEGSRPAAQDVETPTEPDAQDAQRAAEGVGPYDGNGEDASDEVTPAQEPAPAHVHTPACYELRLICDKAEHEHSLVCFADVNADLETEEVWAASVAGVELTGVWADDVVAIAKSQLGQGESEKNYMVDAAGAKQGYTRFGAWWGAAYEPWCAMFVSFVLNYAAVPETAMPRDAGCAHWQGVLQEQGLWRAAADYTPKAGDIVFFDHMVDGYRDGQADHVGLVSGLELDEGGVLTKLETIEGNNSNKVETFSYAPDDGRILGYGVLPENPEAPAASDEGILTSPAAPQDDSNGEPAVLTADPVDGVVVTMTADPASLPYPAEELRLSVAPVVDEAAEALIDSETQTAEGAVRKTVLFDIKILHGSEEVQPLGPVSVSFAGIETPNNDAQVFHVDTAAEAVEEVTAVAAAEGEVAMETEHFSLYGVSFTVDFHWGDYTFSIAGETDIRLSALFAELGIERDAAQAVSVVFSDPELVRVDRLESENDWLLTSLAPFQTEEKLSITFSDGSVLEIKVTDAQPTGLGHVTIFDAPDVGESGTFYAQVDGRWLSFTVFRTGPGEYAGNVPDGLISDQSAVTNARLNNYSLSEGAAAVGWNTYTGNASSGGGSSIIVPANPYTQYGDAFFMSVKLLSASTGAPLNNATFNLRWSYAGWNNGSWGPIPRDVPMNYVVSRRYGTYVYSSTNGPEWYDAANEYVGAFGDGYKWDNGSAAVLQETVTPRGYRSIPNSSWYAFQFSDGIVRSSEKLSNENLTSGNAWLYHRLSITVIQPPITATLRFRKLNKAGNPITNAGFTLTGTSSIHGYFERSSVHTGDGWYEIRDVYFGESTDTYTVTETTVPAGYKAVSFPVTGNRFQTQGATYTYSNNVVDNPVTGTIRIKKTNSAGTPLPGAKFKLSGTTDLHGYFETTSTDKGGGIYEFYNVPWTPTTGQAYKIEETSTPTGYAKCADFYVYADRLNPTYDWVSNGVYILENDTWMRGRVGFDADGKIVDPVATGTVRFRKLGRINNTSTDWWIIENASFKLTGTGIDGKAFSLTSTYQSDGWYVINNVPVGAANQTYTLEETTTPNGYLKADNVTFAGNRVTANGTYNITTNFDNNVWNYPAGGPLRFRKVKPNGEPLDGAVFTLSGTTNALNPALTFTRTSEALGNGWYQFSNVPGRRSSDVYTVTETTTPTGYEPITFTATGPQSFLKDGVAFYPITSDWATIEAGYTDPAITGTLRFTKVDKDDHSIKLDGAVFTVTGSSSIHGDLSALNLSSTPVAGQPGVYEIAGIPYGLATDTYTVVETLPPPGYAPTSFDIHWSDFTEDGSGGMQYLYPTEVEDEKHPGELRFFKVSELNENHFIPGAVFTLTGSVGGVAFPSLTSTEVPGSPGEYRFTGVPAGTASDEYTITETTVPDGCEAARPFKVTGDNFDPANGTYTHPTKIVDPAITGTLRFKKVSGADNSTPVTGAVFTMTGPSTVHGAFTLTSSPVDPSLVGGEQGWYEITGVPYGAAGDNYTVTETTVPDGYLACTPFTVAGSRFDTQGGVVTLSDPIVDPPEVYPFTVTNTIVNGPNGKTFPFEIVITKPDGRTRYISPGDKVKVTDASGAPVTGVEVDPGTGVISVPALGNGWKVVVEDVPAGSTVVTTQKDHTDYSVTVGGDGEKDTANSGSDTTKTNPVSIDGPKTVDFTSERKLLEEGVTVMKTVTGGGVTTAFPFRIEITKDDLPTLSTTVYDKNGDEDTTRTVRITGGLVEVELADGEKIVIGNVPVNSKLAVSETQHDGYTVLIKNITDGGDNEAGDSWSDISINQATTIEVVNNPGYELPHTGGAGTSLYALGGVSIMLSTVLLGLARRRRKGEA